jgi:predicted N-acetyltransferase YhbS
VIDLWTEAYVDEGDGGRTLPYSEDDFLEATRNGQVFVAEQDGAVSGVVALLAPGAPGRAVGRAGEAELARLVVGSGLRRRGIGRALAERCAELARVEGWPAIALWSRPYESLGYERAPERDMVDETGFNRLVFRLSIEPSSPSQG